MSTIEFTPEQADAIGRRDGTVFLRAAAGSGKTAVLVERFVRAVIDDGVGADRILAITFTEKAAAELKTRVRNRFLELGRREEARAAEGAWVSTIHGFCSRVLRTHALSAGIDPDYRVLDELEAGRAALEGFDAALEEFLGQAGEEERLELVASFNPDKLQRMVRTVHARLRSAGQRVPELPVIPPPRAEGGEREALEAAARAALAELGGAKAGKTVARAMDALQDCLDRLERLAPGELGDAEAFRALRVPRNANALKTDTVQGAVDALEAWCAACSAPKDHLQYTLLRELIRRFSERYAAAKERRAGLDFDDLELLVRDLLRGNDGLRESYRERFAHVMVDEFQDTNRLQVDVLELVARPETLFTVGDEFQSIYLFRHADVELFRERGAAAAAEGAERRLTANFRSAPEVLEVLNRAFDEEFEDFARLTAERPSAGSGPAVELMVTDADPKRWQDRFGEDADPFGFGRREVTLWRMAEARLVAARVRELIDEGVCVAGEVAVLLRATTDSAVYEQALEELGVPTYVSGGRGYWTQQQVADMRTYLAALANPRDEQALMSLLGSPLVGVSTDTLALIARRRRDHRDRNAWSLLEDAFAADAPEAARLPELEEGDHRRLADFVPRFRRERADAPRMSLESLVDRAIAAPGYDLHVLSLHAGRRRMANLRKLMRLARSFEADEGRDLRGFIDLLDEQAELELREGQAPLEAEALQAVRMMSVHAAKGLEFPVVVLADLGRRIAGDDDPLVVTDDGRVGLKLASMSGDSTEAMDLPGIREDQQAQQDEEERRVFYVAMTRAERRLIVSGATRVEKWPEHKPLGPPIDWVHRALAPGFTAVATAESPVAVVDGVRCVLNTPDTVDALLTRDRMRPTAPRASAAQEQMPLPPEFASVERSEPLPVSRLSYTGLESHAQCGYRFYLERVLGLRRLEDDHAPAEAARDGMPPLLRGSVAHRLLEDLDFAAPAPPTADVVAALIPRDEYEPTDWDVEDLRRLVAAFGDTDLCRRLAAARAVRRELPFVYALGVGGERSLLMNGVVDVHAEEDDRLLIVDYKTNAVDEAGPAEQVQRSYEGQRLVYALAALRSGVARVEVAYSFLERPGEPVLAVYEAAQEAELEDALRELAAGVTAADFPVSDHPHRDLCLGCPGRRSLCSWPEDRTLAPAESL